MGLLSINLTNVVSHQFDILTQEDIVQALQRNRDANLRKNLHVATKSAKHTRVLDQNFASEELKKDFEVRKFRKTEGKGYEPKEDPRYKKSFIATLSRDLRHGFYAQKYQDFTVKLFSRDSELRKEEAYLEYLNQVTEKLAVFCEELEKSNIDPNKKKTLIANEAENLYRQFLADQDISLEEELDEEQFNRAVGYSIEIANKIAHANTLLKEGKLKFIAGIHDAYFDSLKRNTDSIVKNDFNEKILELKCEEALTIPKEAEEIKKFVESYNEKIERLKKRYGQQKKLDYLEQESVKQIVDFYKETPTLKLVIPQINGITNKEITIEIDTSATQFIDNKLQLNITEEDSRTLKLLGINIEDFNIHSEIQNGVVAGKLSSLKELQTEFVKYQEKLTTLKDVFNEFEKTQAGEITKKSESVSIKLKDSFKDKIELDNNNLSGDIDKITSQLKEIVLKVNLFIEESKKKAVETLRSIDTETEKKPLAPIQNSVETNKEVKGGEEEEGVEKTVTVTLVGSDIVKQKDEEQGESPKPLGEYNQEELKPEEKKGDLKSKTKEIKGTFITKEEVEHLEQSDPDQLKTKLTEQNKAIDEEIEKAAEEDRQYQLISEPETKGDITIYKYCLPDSILKEQGIGKNDASYHITYNVNNNDGSMQVIYGSEVKDTTVYQKHRKSGEKTIGGIKITIESEKSREIEGDKRNAEPMSSRAASFHSSNRNNERPSGIEFG